MTRDYKKIADDYWRFAQEGGASDDLKTLEDHHWQYAEDQVYGDSAVGLIHAYYAGMVYAVRTAATVNELVGDPYEEEEV